MVNEAALAAARQNRKAVLMYDFEVAKDKVLMGVERKSMILSDEEKKVTAYHEAGHALVAAKLPNSDPVHKVTIIPRGMALGVTQQLPIDDRHNYTKEYLQTDISILMGGRLAEEIFLTQMSTGAGNDIERATELARKMVCEWGMSDLGPLTFGKKEEQIFLRGHRYQDRRGSPQAGQPGLRNGQEDTGSESRRAAENCRCPARARSAGCFRDPPAGGRKRTAGQAAFTGEIR